MIDLGAELTAWLDRPEIQDRFRRLVRAAVREALVEAVEADYLSVANAAKMAGVSEKTIRRWIDAGKLLRYGAGRLVRVRRCELDAVLESDTGDPAGVIDIRQKARELVRGRDE